MAMWTLTAFHGPGKHWLDATFEFNLHKRTLRINLRSPFDVSYWVREDGKRRVVLAHHDLIDHLIAHWTLVGEPNGFPKYDIH